MPDQEMLTKLKRLPTEWEKIFASFTSDKELITNHSIQEAQKIELHPKINDPVKK
jgi:hypothetical protein